MAILIAAILTISTGASLTLEARAALPVTIINIPTYAYIVSAPGIVGVGQTPLIYMWLDPVYGAAGGTTAKVPGNGSTASAALLSNNYRFLNFILTITSPNGTSNTLTFPVISDPTSSQFYRFTPTQVGTYNLTFNYSGQVYGANGDGYSGSPIYGSTYLPSSASTTLTVQQQPIPAAITGEPLPTNYWTHPIYAQNSNWYTISSNWLGSGSGLPAGYTSSTLFVGDAIGPETVHIMWTTPITTGGTVGGNKYPSSPGVDYFNGDSYEPRFLNPIIIDGILYYTGTVSYTGSLAGPTNAVDLLTGKVLWSSTSIPPLSFGYIYNLYDPDQHGTFLPILVAQVATIGYWELFDGFTGDSLFNVTGVPVSSTDVIAAPIAGQHVYNFSQYDYPPSLTGSIISSVPGEPPGTTVATALGPNGEQLRYEFINYGTPLQPSWYLMEWNSSKLWSYDINPYTGGGSFSPAVQNATGVMVGGSVNLFGSPVIDAPTAIAVNNPVATVANGFGFYNAGLFSSSPVFGETGTNPDGSSVLVPYGSTILVNGSEEDIVSTANPFTRYDWNVSTPWLNTMPLQDIYVPTVLPFPFPQLPGTCPLRIVAVNPGDVMLCENGSLPTGYGATRFGYPELPWTMFAVNLNASLGAIGSILWMQTYNPPAGNESLIQGPVDFQTRTIIFSLQETMQWEGYSLTTGNLLWGPIAPQSAFDYYGNPGTTTLPGVLAYGNLYCSSFSGICYAYNDLTGKLLWTWGNGPPGSDNSTYAGFSTNYGDYPTQIQAIANGVVELATEEHTITNPIYKGATMELLNATTGQEIPGSVLSEYPSEWSTPGSAWAVADGYLTMLNGYDMQIYGVGRGSSATAVQAPQTAITAGNSVVIQGTVMDTSAGTQQAEQKADFPNGVPVASDSIMGAWMGYVYQQQPAPINFTGVTVTLTAIDPNGNFITLGTATTDSSGLYHYAWTSPNIAGNYLVTATFAGTNGYWGSSAQTDMVVQGPSATSAPTSTPAGLATASDVTYGIIAAVIAIIIAIAIVGLLLLRKKP